MQTFINSFKDGMNQDISYNNYPNTHYFDLVNLRVITSDTDGTTGSLRNVKGNAASFTIPNSGTLLGYTIMRDHLIIFVTTDEAIPDRIYRIPLSALKTAGDLILTNTYYWLAADTDVDTLVYKADLGFSTDYPIHPVANYETETVQKVYWVDSYNVFRHLNIVNDDDTNPLGTLSAELLEIVPKNDYGSFSLSLQQGGRLKASRVQYAYQLYAVNGTETMFSPASGMINITSSPISPSSSYDYKGSTLEDFSNKSVAITITLPESTQANFNRLRLVALDYEAYTTTPLVRIISEMTIGSTTINVTDIGISIGSMALETFRFIQNEIIPKTLDSYKNFLFAGNITQNYFDVDTAYTSCDGVTDTFLDTRSYRFRKDTTGSEQEIYTMKAHYTGGDVDIALSYISCAANAWEIRITTDIKDIIDAAGGKTWGGLSRIESATGVNYLAISAPDGSGGVQYIHLSLDDTYTETFTNAATDYITITGTNYETGYEPDPTIFDATPEASDYSWYIKVFYWYTETAIGEETYRCYVNRQDSKVQEVTSPDFDEPLETHDCVNTFNWIANDFSDEDEFFYNADGSAIGGSGKFIDFEFDISKTVDLGDETTDVNSSVFIRNTSPYNSYQDADYVIDYVGYQRDEVYRWASVWYDLQGRPSYCKWVADIRNPRIEESNPFASKLVGNILAVKFTIKWSDLPAEFRNKISGVQFVRANRTDFDKTIKASGIITGVCEPDYDNDDNYYYSTNTLMSVNNYNTPTLKISTEWEAQAESQGPSNLLVDFISPEIAFNKNVTLNNDDSFMQLHSFGKWGRTNDTEFHYTATNEGAGVQEYVGANKAHITNLRQTIHDFFISLPEQETAPVHIIADVGGGTLSYKSRISNTESTANDTIRTYKGTSLIARIEDKFTNTTSNGDGNNMLLGYCRTDLGYSIYGGNTYNARSYTEYIPASAFIATDSSDTDYIVYGGDTYLCMFTYLRAGWDKNVLGGTADEDGMYETYYTFPVESALNINCRSDIIENFMNLEEEGSGIDPEDDYEYKLAEFVSTGVGMFPNDYPEDLGNLYMYNSVYSASDKSKVFLAKPFDYSNQKVFDTRVTSSQQKIVNEYSDSWTKFLFNNYIDLEGEQGSLTRIINQHNKLFAFQERGISSLPIQEREVVQSNNTAELVVGSGGILQRFDYLTKSVGSTLHDAIRPTDNGIYFYDDNNTILYRLGEKLEPLSDIKGMKSFMNTANPTDMILGYDKANREVLSSSDDFTKTLVYNGYMGAFAGFYTLDDGLTHYVNKYIMFDKYLLSTIDKNKFYLHNVGDYGTFYDTIHGSSITLITNPQRSHQVSSMYILEWLTDLYNGVTEVKDTFTSLQMWNTYQDTGILPLTYYDEAELTGTHTGANGQAFLTDSTQDWVVDEHIDRILKNYTDKSSTTVTDSGATTVTGILAGGTDNDWDNGDMYKIVYDSDILTRRLRKWRYNLLRDSTDGGRMRDSYVKTKFIYDNANNYKLTVYDIITQWKSTKI